MTTLPTVSRSLLAALLLVAALPPPPARAEAPPAPAPAAVPTWKYFVGPGDILAVAIRAGGGEEAMDLKLTVAGDGTIDVPHVSRVKVGGLTTQEIGQVIERRLRDGGYLKAPHVSVNVEQYLSQCVNVAGFVTTPGRYCLKRETRLLDILSEAGGVLESEAADVVRIMRKGATEPIRIRRSLLVGTDLDAAREANVVVLPEDNIYVPKKAVFCVLGPVKAPGCNPLQDGMTLLGAISVVGGLDEKANRHEITIRRGPAGATREIVVDLDALPAEGPPAIEPDDQIVVGEVELTQFCITGAVTKPDCYDFQGRLTLQEAVSKGGSVEEERADKREIKIVRKVGASDQQFIVNLEESGPKGAGFEILSGDQIVVPELPLVVWVSGAVTKEGAVPWHRGLTISDALSAAGCAGAGDSMAFAKMSGIVLRREGSPPQVIDVKAIFKGKREDVLLQPGDRVYVPRKAM